MEALWFLGVLLGSLIAFAAIAAIAVSLFALAAPHVMPIIYRWLDWIDGRVN